MKTVGLFQQAFITFERKDITLQFYDQYWTILMMRHALRVLPLILSDAQRSARRQYSLKLSGLPKGTLPRNIASIVKEVNAKTCVITRNPNNYNPVNYAYLSFTSSDHIATAIEKEFSYKGNPLYWSTDNTPTCNICGNPEHLARNCNSPKNKFTPKNAKLQNLYRRFRPAQHRRQRKSYADTLKGQNNQQYDQQRQQELGSLKQSITTLVDQLGAMQQQIVDLRNDINKKNNGRQISQTFNNNKIKNVNTSNSAITTANPILERFNNSQKSNFVPRKRNRVTNDQSSSETDNSTPTQNLPPINRPPVNPSNEIESR